MNICFTPKALDRTYRKWTKERTQKLQIPDCPVVDKMQAPDNCYC